MVDSRKTSSWSIIDATTRFSTIFDAAQTAPQRVLSDSNIDNSDVVVVKADEYLALEKRAADGEDVFEVMRRTPVDVEIERFQRRGMSRMFTLDVK